MVWKWANEQMEFIEGSLWRGVASGHFIYSFNKQLGPHCVPGTVVGFRHEAVVRRDRFLPS